LSDRIGVVSKLSFDEIHVIIMGSEASLLAEVDNDRELSLDDLTQLLGSSADSRTIERLPTAQQIKPVGFYLLAR
jgi:hypothetical protein